MNSKSVIYYALIANAIFLCCLFLCGCTYNVSMAHTEGTATDVIDDNMSNAPNISPTITPGGLG